MGAVVRTCTAARNCHEPVVCFDAYFARQQGRNGFACAKHCDHGIPRGEQRTCVKVKAAAREHHVCMYDGCKTPGRWHVVADIYKCDDHYKRDRERPWGSVTMERDE